MAVTLYSGPF